MSYEKAIALRAFLQSATTGLGVAEREQILGQALILLEQLYAHLPLKRAMFAVDPVQRLRLLGRRLPRIPDAAFHREVLSIFTELRDLHTSYSVPEPFASHVAVLPFLVEEHHEAGEARYLVTRVVPAAEEGAFRRGARVTHWNGVPIGRAIDVHAASQPGGNDAARRARGLASLTLRPLGSSPPPDEEWVIVTFVGEDGAPGERRFEWRVMPAWQSWIEEAHEPEKSPEVLAGGIDRSTESMRRAKKQLFAPDAMEREDRAAALWSVSAGSGAEAPPRAALPEMRPGESALPDNFSFRAVDTPHGRFGYLRIWSFENTTAGPGRKSIEGFVDAFVEEAIRILGDLPQEGLIVDVRGNPGGRIPAGERLLELLSPTAITGAPLCFRNTVLVAELCRAAPASIELSFWRESVEQAVETGAVYSAAHPFMPFARSYNGIGQVYQGPAVLVVDALSYSTADIFAAGFQDHGIGPVLGVAESTGAGGANMWPHQAISQMLRGSRQASLAPLPGGASFTVAIRQATRVGPRAGVPLEDLGVVPDFLHRLTKNDILGQNEDLLARAGELLASRPQRSLRADIESRDGPSIRWALTTRNVPRVDVYVNGRPRHSVDTPDGETRVDVPCAPGDVLDLRGHDGDAQVARRRVVVTAG